jgi:hypothetical protein
MRITPQQKIIQVIGNAEPEIQKALEAAAKMAITRIHDELF